MPRFFIATRDTADRLDDDAGLEFDDIDAARRALLQAMPQMAGDSLPGGVGAFSATLLDNDRQVLGRIQLRVTEVWPIGVPDVRDTTESAKCRVDRPV